MAAYTTINGASVLVPGKPLTSAIAQALNENPTAITEGASGAPRIRTAAMQAPAAGSTAIRQLEDVTAQYVSPDTTATASLAEGSVGVLVPGTIRVVSTIAVAGTTSSWSVVYAKNGTAFATFSTTTGVQFSDVAVALGDRITITATATGGSGTGSVSLTDVKIESATADFAVA